MIFVLHTNFAGADGVFVLSFEFPFQQVKHKKSRKAELRQSMLDAMKEEMQTKKTPSAPAKLVLSELN